ncbi:MAG: glycosyltransferase family 4 protein [Chloroflexota bacterium]|nr:MAG: glycosyltransferase family 4 protein [Chloroflexota bacterium]
MVAPTSFFNDYGGHIRILEETLALQGRGHQVTVVTYYMGGDVPGLDIRRTRPLPWRADYEVGSSRHKIAFDIYLAAKVLATGRKIRPDVVHGHMHEGALIGGLLAKHLGVPAVFDYQGSLTGEMVDHGFLNPDGRYYPWMHRMERYICNLPDAILTSSIRAERNLIEGFGVKPDKIHALPDCVDTDRFDPERVDVQEKAALRRQLGIPDGRTIVAYLGLLADYQGIPQLIEAVAGLERRGADIHFLIMGYPRVDYYMEMARAAGVAERTTFTGKVSYDQAPKYLALGDLAVSAKVSATEGSGKVLNYMAMGQPVVASDTPVHREYLDTLGVYGRPGDAVGLADGIEGFMKDPIRAQETGRLLRARAHETYSWRKAGERISAIYARLVDRQPD